jgi:hypothetical protein
MMERKKTGSYKKDFEVAMFGKVADLPAIVARVPSRCWLLWCPDYYLLLLWGNKSTVVLLQLLQLVLLVVAPELLWRLARLSHGWCVDNVVLWRITA